MVRHLLLSLTVLAVTASGLGSTAAHAAPVPLATEGVGTAHVLPVQYFGPDFRGPGYRGRREWRHERHEEFRRREAYRRQDAWRGDRRGGIHVYAGPGR